MKTPLCLASMQNKTKEKKKKEKKIGREENPSYLLYNRESGITFKIQVEIKRNQLGEARM